MQFLIALLLFVAADSKVDVGWGNWRGPAANGSVSEADPPLRWSEDQHVQFKVAVPGRGLSTPVVWGDRLFLTTAIPFGDLMPHDESDHDHGAHDNVAPQRKLRFEVHAYDRHSGKLLWRRVAREAQPHESTHATGSWASASAVTDGRRLIASFGSQGLYAYDLDGKPLWQRDLGKMRVRHAHGEGSSPAMLQGRIVVNWDHEGESFIVALDAKDGKELWRQPRNEMTSWSSPLIVKIDGVAQVIVAATGAARSYRLKDGKILWEQSGLSRNVVATPVVSGTIAVVANSYDTRAMMAIRLGGVEGDRVLWRRDRDTPYVPSPAIWKDQLIFNKHLSPILTSVKLESGEPVWGPLRLNALRGLFASPVVANGRVYVAAQNGVVAVLDAKTGESLAMNQLEDGFSASPAIVGRTLYLRGDRYLYALRTADE